MKRVVLPLLVVADLILMAAIFFAWTAGDAAWRAPPAHLPDPSSLAPERFEVRPPEPAALAEMLERPLFDRDRRPPELTAEGEGGEGPDDMVLLGIFVAGGKEKGVLVRADGVAQRVHVGESIGQWRLEALDGRVATFTRGDERRELALTHLPQPEPAPGAAARPPPRPVRPAPAQPGTRPGVIPQAERSADRRQRRGSDNQ